MAQINNEWQISEKPDEPKELQLLNVDRGLSTDGGVFATCPHCMKTIYWNEHIQEGVNYCSHCGAKVNSRRFDND